MIKIFRKIRQNMIKENKVSKYMLYAIGEIVLVVIGILIALSINNCNEKHIIKNKELNYLENIKSDLKVNILELNKVIESRSDKIASSTIVLAHFEGKPLDNLEDFNYHNINMQIWKKFYQSNNTYQELINSGNFAILSNKDIKNSLLDLELLFKKMKSDEDHMRFDFEEYIYKPFFNTVNLNPFVNNYAHRVSNGQAGEKVELSRNEIETLLNNTKFKNGVVLAIYMNNQINSQFEVMKSKCEDLIETINIELKKR